MKTKVLNYRVIVKPDVQTGTNKPGFTAYCPTLGVADDGDTIEEALQNVQGAIETYIEGLTELGEEVPAPDTNKELITSTQVTVPSKVRLAF